MALFPANPARVDPYKNFKFRVYFSGRPDPILGVCKMTALKRTIEIVEHREGGDPSTSHKSPGRIKYEAITLERGVTQDTDFEEWANKVWNLSSGDGTEVSLKDFRRNLIIELRNDANQVVLKYNLYLCCLSQ